MRAFLLVAMLLVPSISAQDQPDLARHFGDLDGTFVMLDARAGRPESPPSSNRYVGYAEKGSAVYYFALQIVRRTSVAPTKAASRSAGRS